MMTRMDFLLPTGLYVSREIVLLVVEEEAGHDRAISKQIPFC